MRFLVAGCACATIVACTEPQQQQKAAPLLSSGKTSIGSPVSLPFDASRVIARVGRTWVERAASDPRYEARISATGLSFLPRRAVGARREEASRPLQVRTARVAVGSKTLFAAERCDAAVRHRGQRAERALAAGVTERFIAKRGAVEQQWLIERLPERGELVIDVALAGMRYEGRSRDALHFRDGEGKIGVTYGAATARDAEGLVAFAAPQRTPSGLRITFPAHYVARAKLPLMIDPDILGEFGMDTAIAERATEDQYYARVATNGSNYLVVWQDYRTMDGTFHIYGARVDAAGAVLDPTGIEISSSANEQAWPDVAFGDGTYLVAWHERGSSPQTSGWDIYGARVTPAGAVTDNAALAINTYSGDQVYPRIAYGGGRFLVVWRQSGGGASSYDLRATRVLSNGTVQDTGTGIVVTGASRQQYNHDVASNGTDFLVAWEDYRNYGSTYWDVYAGRVIAASGATPDGDGLPISVVARTQRDLSVASNGDNWLIVWEDDRDIANNWGVYGARVQADGTTPDGDGFVISGCGGPSHCGGSEYNPWVFPRHGTTDYFVTWRDGNIAIPGNPSGTHVSAAGVVLQTPGFAVTRPSDPRAYAYNAANGHYMAVWDSGGGLPDHGDQGGTASDVYYRRMTSDGAAVDSGSVPVTFAHNGQYYPAVAFDGTNYLVVWADSRNRSTTGMDIFGVRVDQSGNVLEPGGSPIAICTRPDTDSHPAVAFDGTNYLVVWESIHGGGTDADIIGGRVTTGGQTLDGQGNVFSQQDWDQKAPQLVFDQNSQYLVVWQDYRSNSNWDVYGIRVSSNEALPIDVNPIPISVDQNHDEQEPDVAFDGTNFLVVWADARAMGTRGWDIFGARVTLGGEVVADDLAGKPVNTRSGDQRYPSLIYATKESKYFLAWADGRFAAGYRNDIFGNWVSTEVVPASSDGIEIYFAQGDQTRPRVSYVGSVPTVVWEDWANFNVSKGNISGARVGANSVIETFTISTDPRNELRPAITGGNDESGLVAYMHYDPKLKTVRVVGRVYMETCANDDDCPAGTFCDNGVCRPCNTAAHCGPSCTPCAAAHWCDGQQCLPCNTSQHCGASCQACGGGTPYCSGTACVECLDDNHCTPPEQCIGNVCVSTDAGVDIGLDMPVTVDAGPEASADSQTGDGQTGDGQTGDGQTGDGQTGDGQTGDGQTSDSQTSDSQTGDLPVGGDDTMHDGGADDGATADGAGADGVAGDGAVDGGASDGAGTDASATQDGGTGGDGSASSPEDGCNCQVGGSLSNSPLLLLLGLALLRRRRRRRRL